ncbi:MAG: hypothetical protein GSR85_07130 [Desulfurococcales archaeon]|nr:hypothetical protein [Desulfurococcales archaeon]
MSYELEVVEEYLLHGERRFKLRVKGSKITVNVAADSIDEAMEKARNILKKIRADRVIRG